jgi:hypothetical protein
VGQRIKRLNELPYQDIDKQRLAGEQLEYTIAASDFDRLRQVDWTAHGDIRGLGQILRAAMTRGRSVAEAIAEHESVAVRDYGPKPVATLLDEIQGMAQAGRSLIATVNAAEQSLRCDVVDLLLADDSRFSALAVAMQLNPSALRKQLSDLKRDRKRRQ